MSFIVKNTTFPGLLDLLAPHSCRGCGSIGEALCERCKKYILNNYQSICPICKSPSYSGKCQSCNIPTFFAIGPRTNLLASLISDYKYSSIRALAIVLAELLDKSTPSFPENSVLVPLPTSTKHIRERGFDHTLKIAKYFSKLKRLPIEQILLRNKNTVQVGTTSKKRKEQAEQAYTINPKFTIDKTKTYVLFDDIWTTGASMNAAIKKLRDAGAENFIILLLAVSEI